MPKLLVKPGGILMFFDAIASKITVCDSVLQLLFRWYYLYRRSGFPFFPNADSKQMKKMRE